MKSACVVHASESCFQLCAVISQPTNNARIIHLRIIEADFRRENYESLNNI